MAQTTLLLLLSTFATIFIYCESKHHHNNQNKLIELLTAGIVAKVLQKQDGGGGHHHQEYYPVPIHVPIHHGGGHHMHGSESQRSHHHVTEKIIPIPIPHHTTRIIHINAGSNSGSSSGGSDISSTGGGYDSGTSYGGDQNQYDGQDHDDPPAQHSGSSPNIQQIVFQDSGIYSPPVAPQRQPAYMAYRRPVIGIMPAAAAHHAYIMRGRYPYVAVRQRVPQAMIAPSHYRAPVYAMPYRAMPVAASYMNPLVMRRPTAMWYG